MRRVIDTDFNSAALWMQAAADILPKDRPRTLIVIGSVAGDRGRQSNYAHGAAKAGSTSSPKGSPPPPRDAPMLTVKPGFVDTPMTAHLDRGGRFPTPDRIAATSAGGETPPARPHAVVLGAGDGDRARRAASSLRTASDGGVGAGQPARGGDRRGGPSARTSCCARGARLRPRRHRQHPANTDVLARLHPGVRLVRADLARDDGWQESLAGAAAQ